MCMSHHICAHTPCDHIMRVCKELTFFAVCRHSKEAFLRKTGQESDSDDAGAPESLGKLATMTIKMNSRIFHLVPRAHEREFWPAIHF